MREKKKVKPIHGLLCILFLTIIIFGSIVALGLEDPFIPVGCGCVIAGLMAAYLGFGWEELVGFIVDGIRESVEAILIIISIGILVGVWVAAGVVPSMIYYGLSIISPRLFLVTAFFVCSLVSLLLGAWGAIGTIGIAVMGIGVAIGYDPGIVCGAIVSGAYVGDKISPFSDATNLAASVSSANLLGFIKRAMPLSLITYAATAVIFTVAGFLYRLDDTSAIETAVRPILDSLDASFRINPFALLPLVVMLLLVFFRVPALPAILAGAGVGAVQAAIMQRCGLYDILVYGSSGFVSNTGNGVLDTLLSAGGASSMMSSVSIIIVAMSFGGIMRGTGMFSAFVAPLVRRIRSAAGMIPLVIGSCLCMNILLPDQNLGIAITGQMYREQSRERGMDGELLANALGAGAAVTSPLVPWNTCGIYITSILGVGTLAYAPFAFFNYLLPVVFIVYGFLPKRKTAP